MNSYARLVESVRRTRNTLYLVAGLYIVVGFIVATATAMQRDRLGTFLGFMIISGALSMGLIARTALQVLVRIAHIEESLDDFAERIEGLIPLVAEDKSAPTVTVAKEVSVMDLAGIGVGDPALLTAATLDRDVYPRLVSAMEQPPPDWPSAGPEPEPSLNAKEIGDSKHGPGNGTNGSSARTRNLLQQWKSALADEDLAQCRQVFSAIVDLAQDDEVWPLKDQIRELEDRIERRLRERFTHQIHSRNFVAALETGHQMTSLLGDRPIAAEFARLRPILTRRADEVMATASGIA